ncbi:hypothetical protein DFQ27_008446 [Actinomortierella ambigua]|uniref:Domain of unknown function at the cortex 1 domain-containing protein n=1 Tax=Actinomortierella ambigua TaxID=1343610 RepID=A0A9P6QIX9_9FUNG|nr:hypothetical protein DFQ27_008446 [Actinomortierella ambigua]
MASDSHQQYRLRVSAGSSLQDLRVLNINDDAHPLFINTPDFVGQLCVRVRGLSKSMWYEQAQVDDNLTPLPESPWFEGNDNLSCIQVSGRFKKEHRGDDIVWGNEFERPLKLPPFSSVAVKFGQYIDPGLQVDLYSDKPWAFSPLLTTMNTINVTGWHMDEHSQERAKEKGKEDAVERALPPWPSPTGIHIVEDTSLLFFKLQKDDSRGSLTLKDDNQSTTAAMSAQTLSLSSEERKAYFTSQANLEKHTFMPDQIYAFDFFNPYIDFVNFTLKLPGFSLDAVKYWDGQPLRYIAKTKDSSTVFFVVVFELVPVNDISIE